MKPNLTIFVLVYTGFIFLTCLNLKYLLTETQIIWYYFTILIPYMIIQFVEGESFKNRMGLSYKNIILTGSVSFLGVYAIFYFNGSFVKHLAHLIFTPWVEEVFFRGFLILFLSKTLNEKRTSPWKSIFIVSLLFSITHVLVGFNLLSIFFAFTFSICVGHLYIKFNAILLPFFLHFMWNLATSFDLTLVSNGVLVFTLCYTIYGLCNVLMGHRVLVLSTLQNIGQQLEKQKSLR